MTNDQNAHPLDVIANYPENGASGAAVQEAIAKIRALGMLIYPWPYLGREEQDRELMTDISFGDIESVYRLRFITSRGRA